MFLIVIFVLLSNTVLCEKWKDPYNMLEIFDDPGNSCNDKSASVGSSPVNSEQFDLSCSELAKSIVSSINKQLSLQTDTAERDVTLTFSLTQSDVQSVIKYIPHGPSAGSICSVLMGSLNRPSSRHMFSWVGDFISYLIDNIKELYWYLRYSMTLDPKSFVSVQLYILCISSVVILFFFRSIKLLLVWISLGLLFITVYTEYQHLYQVKVAKREESFSRLSGEIPPQCKAATRKYYQGFLDWLTGSTLCLDFFKSIHVSPEIEIKLTDVVMGIIGSGQSSFIGALLTGSYDFSVTVAEEFSLPLQWIVMPIMFILALMFSLLVLALCVGRSLSLPLGFKVGGSSERPNRVEFLPPRIAAPEPVVINKEQVLPPAEWLHDLIEFRERSVENRLLNNDPDNDGRVDANSLRITDGRGKVLHRLRSEAELKSQAPSKTRTRRTSL